MKLSKRSIMLAQIILVLIIAAATLILPGSDIYTHVHQSWLFNYMMQNKVLLSEDFSMLSGHQPLYGSGTFSYALAGLGWFFFQKSVIKVLEAVLFIGLVLVSLKLFKNKNVLFFWYALILAKILLPDSYPYMFSMFLFYSGLYLIKRFREKPLGDIAIAAAGLNHPYFAVTNLATILLGRWPLFLSSVVILLVQFLAVKYVFLSGMVDFEFDNVLDLAIRTAVLFFPFFAEWLPKPLLRLANLKNAYYLAAAGIFVFYPFLFVPFEMGWKEGVSCYYAKSYSEIPQLQGSVRIVDDCRSWIYEFPVRGMVTSLSPYFEGQYYQKDWEGEEYLTYLKESNTDFVIFCKDCEIKTKTLQETGELQILRKNFPVYAELKDYIIFGVRKVMKAEEAG